MLRSKSFFTTVTAAAAAICTRTSNATRYFRTVSVRAPLAFGFDSGTVLLSSPSIATTTSIFAIPKISRGTWNENGDQRHCLVVLPLQSTKILSNFRLLSAKRSCYPFVSTSHWYNIPLQLSLSTLKTSSSSASENKDNAAQTFPTSPRRPNIKFKRGDKILVEVLRFGRLGGTVEVVGRGHDEKNIIPINEPVLGDGLILQSEIKYFRDGREGLDVLVGEILPAYVENVRDETMKKLDISLRPPGGGAKTVDLATKILDRLGSSPDGMLEVGDKSTPKEINNVFPGASKGAFKKAVSALYKKGKVRPGPTSISLM